MKNVVVIALFLFAIPALAERPCYEQMSEAAYTQYALDEAYTIDEAKERADLFEEKFRIYNNKYIYNIALAEQQVGEAESGYYPDTEYKIVLTKDCAVISAKRLSH